MRVILFFLSFGPLLFFTDHEWGRSHSEQLSEYFKEYNQKNKEKISEKNKEYNEKNKEKITVRRKEYREKNLGENKSKNIVSKL